MEKPLNQQLLLKRKNKINIHTAVHYNKFELTPRLASPSIYFFPCPFVKMVFMFTVHCFMSGISLTTSWFTILHTFITSSWFNIQIQTIRCSFGYFLMYVGTWVPNENGNKIQNTLGFCSHFHTFSASSLFWERAHHFIEYQQNAKIFEARTILLYSLVFLVLSLCFLFHSHSCPLLLIIICFFSCKAAVAMPTWKPPGSWLES